jgi:hypothetical protein
VPTLSYVSLSVAVSLVVIVMVAAILIWVAGGRYAEKLVVKTAQMRMLHRLFVRSYVGELEKTDPLAARAFAKVDCFSRGRAMADPRVALAILTPAERRAYLALVADQAAPSSNREQRRRRTRR